jgi:hypothetical protein
MKSRFRIVLSVMAVGVLSLACNLLTTPSVPPVTAEVTVQVEPNVLPTTEPAQPTPAASDLPVGLATANDQTISFYDLSGAQVTQVELPQSTAPQRDSIHIAGTMPASGGTVPLLYFSLDNGGALHFRDGNGQIFALLNGSGFLGLTGVPGQPTVAFSQIAYQNTTLRSELYVGSIQTLPSAAPVDVIDDPESWAIKPILLEAENGTPTRIWYTRIAYGIGGDIVYEPRKGLFTLELASGQTNTVLDNTLSPWDISADRSWFAYSINDTQNNSMCVKNIQTGTDTCYPALPASEPRGAGNAFFSPDGSYVAWMEGDGRQMAETPDFKSTVRVGQMDGTVVADLPMKSFENAAGIGSISRAEPVEWLDNQTVIVQVRGQEWSQVALLRYNVASQETSYLAPGEFIGLVYP